MRAVIQRVKSSSVTIEHETVGSIKKGLCILVAVEPSDTIESLKWMVQKIINLRIFEDENGKMNKSLTQVKGELLLVSQFTLLADCVKGRRPSFTGAGSADKAGELFDMFVSLFKQQKIPVQTGVFGAKMAVQILNDGPATFILQSPAANEQGV